MYMYRALCVVVVVTVVVVIVVVIVDIFRSLILQASEFLYKYFTPQGWRYRKALSEAHSHSSKVCHYYQTIIQWDLSIIWT